jgi:hypothetical protein
LAALVAQSLQQSRIAVADIHDIGSAPTCVYLIGNLYEQARRRDGNGCPA